MGTEPPGGRAGRRRPCTDPRIERLALQLAMCRPDLTPQQRMMIAQYVAHYVNTFGDDPYSA